MKFAGSVVAGTLGFILVWTHLAFSSQPLSSYNLLQDVAVERKGGELWVQLKFKNPPVHFQGPKFFKKSIQLDFPFAYVNPSKRYFDTGDDRVKQVYVSQFNPKQLRLRLMLAPGAKIPEDETVVEQVGRVLRIRINPGAGQETSILAEASDPLESLLARASRIQQSNAIQTRTSSGQLLKPGSPVIHPKSSNPQESIKSSQVKKTEKASPLLSQVLGQGLKNEQPKETSSQSVVKTQQAGMLDFENDFSGDKGSGLFSASLKMVSTLGLVLGLMFIIFHLFKKFGLKNSVFGGEGKPIKVLSTGFLAPRKSIALVEVAGDVLVIGISNDQISLLGNVQDPERIEQIKGSLHKKGNDSESVAGASRQKNEFAEPQTREQEKPRVKKEGVDVYNKRLIKSGSTNPFGEYVRQFEGSSAGEPPAMKDVAARVKKNLGEVPVFK